MITSLLQTVVIFVCVFLLTPTFLYLCCASITRAYYKSKSEHIASEKEKELSHDEKKN
jgi:hypothetical protein